MRPPAGGFLVATLRGEPVACGGVQLHGRDPAEIKRMWVAPAVRLETNRSLTEAIAMYRSSGYREVDAFNDEPYGDHWSRSRSGEPAAAARGRPAPR